MGTRSWEVSVAPGESYMVFSRRSMCAPMSLAGVGEGLKLTSVPGELLQWLEQRHLLHALGADVDPALDPQLPRQASQRQRRSAATNAVHRCCLTGCTQQDLLGLCPH